MCTASTLNPGKYRMKTNSTIYLSTSGVDSDLSLFHLFIIILNKSKGNDWVSQKATLAKSVCLHIKWGEVLKSEKTTGGENLDSWHIEKIHCDTVQSTKCCHRKTPIFITALLGFASSVFHTWTLTQTQSVMDCYVPLSLQKSWMEVCMWTRTGSCAMPTTSTG